ncbi:MAG: hypothetical protein AB8B64_07525 [Granulosicoccus sp.]
MRSFPTGHTAMNGNYDQELTDKMTDIMKSPDSIAYTNSHLQPEQMIVASSGLVMITGAGSVIGSIVTGSALLAFGSPGFFNWLASCHVSFVIFALWRMRKRAALPSDQQVPFVAAPFQGAGISTAYSDESGNQRY